MKYDHLKVWELVMNWTVGTVWKQNKQQVGVQVGS